MKKLLMAMFALALLTACSSEPSKTSETAKPQPKPAELLPARSALQKLYISARGWGADARPYRLESTPNADSQGRDGKSAIWRAGFASVAKRGTKPYVWSGSEGPDRGVNPGTEDTYNPNNASTHAFDIAFLKVDSDKAFEVAQQHGGDKLLAKAADTPVLYILEWDVVANELVWHVIYGNSRDDAKLKVAVNGTTGEFIRIEKS
ncbi:MAG: hypothetical protein WA628_17245 [Terriglobales bacterium]